MSVLLLTTVIGLAIAYYFEKQKSQQAIELSKELKNEIGFIEVDDPSLVHIRALHSEGSSHWEFRIYLPPEHGMLFETSLGNPESPKILKSNGAPPSGQFTLTIHEAIDIVKHNRTAKKSFVIGMVADHLDADSIRRYGMSWLKTETDKYQDSLGRYENLAHHTLLCHSDEVKTFDVDEEIPLLRILDQSDAAKGIFEDQRDVISIRLKPEF